MADTDLVRQFFERFPESTPAEMAGWIGKDAQTIRLWRRKLAAREEVTIREGEVRKAIRRRLNGIVADSVAYAEGFLEAVRLMRAKLDEVEGSMLPPGGDVTPLG